MKRIIFLTLALLAAAGIGTGIAFFRQTGEPASKTILPGRADVQSFVQTANDWIATRQKTSGYTLYMANEQTGWRSDGQNLYRTTDGGKSWNAAAPFYDGQTADFLDGSHAFALAKAVRDEEALIGISVYTTANGGESWRHRVLSGTPFFSDEGITRGVDGFAMADRQNGLLILAGDPAAGSHESTVFATKDGGRTFSTRADGVRIPNGQSTFAVSDTSHAYLFVNGSASPVFMLATSDGGKTWKEQDNGLSPRFTDVTPTYVPVRMTTDSRVALLSEQDGIQTTGSKGTTETENTQMKNTFYTLSADGTVSGTLATLDTALPLDAASVSMPDAQTVYAYSRANGKPALYRFTTQSGWTQVQSATLPSDVLEIQFTNIQNGFILQKNALFVTTNGGATWVKHAF